MSCVFPFFLLPHGFWYVVWWLMVLLFGDVEPSSGSAAIASEEEELGSRINIILTLIQIGFFFGIINSTQLIST